MKLYLDTNIIWAWFDKNIRRIKNNQSLEPTSVMEYLSSKGFDLFVSTLTKSEIFRFLKSQHNAPKPLCERIWSEFRKVFEIKELELAEFLVNFNDLTEISLKVSLGKRTFINLIHIQIAKSNKLTFLSGDKILMERLRWYYPRIMDYSTLRKRVP
jgi:predicted nucleic acid-binding protein